MWLTLKAEGFGDQDIVKPLEKPAKFLYIYYGESRNRFSWISLIRLSLLGISAQSVQPARRY